MAELLPVQFESVSADDLVSDTAWWRIYEESFPESERESDAVILHSLRVGVGFAFRAREAGATVGLATIHLLRRPAAVFLVYLAAGSAQRGRGIGSGLFDYARQFGARRLNDEGHGPAGVVWEVDRPDLADGRQEGERCKRRIAFFGKSGGVVLPLPYAQPPLGQKPVKMHLMFRPAAGAPLPAPEEQAAFARAIYFEKYGAINGIAPILLEQLLLESRDSQRE